MSDLVDKLLLYALPLVLGEIIYLRADKKLRITDKIKSKLPIADKWKGLFCFSCTLIMIIVIWSVNIHYTAMYILNGFLTGIGVMIANKISIKSKIMR